MYSLGRDKDLQLQLSARCFPPCLGCASNNVLSRLTLALKANHLLGSYPVPDYSITYPWIISQNQCKLTLIHNDWRQYFSGATAEIDFVIVIPTEIKR